MSLSEQPLTGPPCLKDSHDCSFLKRTSSRVCGLILTKLKFEDLNQETKCLKTFLISPSKTPWENPFR